MPTHDEQREDPHMTEVDWTTLEDIGAGKRRRV
jgi:hypothetical protein